MGEFSHSITLLSLCDLYSYCKPVCESQVHGLGGEGCVHNRSLWCNMRASFSYEYLGRAVQLFSDCHARANRKLFILLPRMLFAIPQISCGPWTISRRWLGGSGHCMKGDHHLAKCLRNKVNWEAKRLRHVFQAKVSMLEESSSTEWWKNIKLLMGLSTEGRAELQGLGNIMAKGNIIELHVCIFTEPYLCAYVFCLI